MKLLSLRSINSSSNIYAPQPNPMEKENGNMHEFYQHVVVMRHGDRIDNFDPLWTSSAPRPWDPPLVDSGLTRAFTTGKILKSSLSFPIHRVFVSPFLRCVQTASKVVSALCPTADSLSIVKVSVEYGLSEMMNTQAIRHNVAPKDGHFSFNIPELESLLPTSSVDHTVKPVYAELPKWEETVAASRNRYAQVIKALADKYPSENLLLVTHGEGVGVSISSFMEDDITVYEVEYCAYSELRRAITENEQIGEFEVQTKSGESGISYYTSAPTVTDTTD